MPKEQQKLPTGKTILRDLDDDGQVLSESHGYGMLEIAIKMEFSSGVKTSEMYFIKQKLASRKRYEKVRAEYTDMPPADAQLEDFGGELLKDVRVERRQRAKAAEQHVPSPETAAHIDSFCESMLATGRRVDAEEWVEATNHTLGEYSHAKSRNLIKKLMRAGAMRIHACDIDCEDDEENTGHLVVELPNDSETRRGVLREVDRLAALQGLRGDLDEGQRYAYVMLD